MRTTRIFAALAALFLSIPAQAQQSVLQSGIVTRGHAARWINPGVIGDAGGAAGSSVNGAGYLTELGITNTGTPLCINDALTNAVGGYHQFCLGANALGSGLISFNAYGGASPLGLTINLNGVNYAFPGAGSGNVVGPASPAPSAGNFVLWNGSLTVKDAGFGVSNMAPSVATNAALAATATTLFPGGLWRDDYAAGVNAGPQFFKVNSGTCVANGDTDNGGTCTNSSDGNSYSAVYSVLSAKQFGLYGNGSTNDGPGMTRIFSSPVANTVYFPAGTYRLPCGTYYAASASMSMVGAGKKTTTLKLDGGCALTSDLFNYTNRSGVSVRNLTIDLNNMAETASQVAGLAFYVSSGALIGPQVDGIEIINGRAASVPGDAGVFLLRINVTNAAGSWVFPLVQNSYFQMAPSTVVNAAIATGGIGAGQSLAPANISDLRILHNTAVGGGIWAAGRNSIVDGNDVSGYQYGTGIFTLFDLPLTVLPDSSQHDCLVLNNIIHDTSAGYDADNTPAGGIENNCIRARISGNQIYRLGGEGIRNYGDGTVIEGNIIFDNAKETAIFGNYVRAGISLVQASRTLYNSTSIVVNGNSSYDTGAGTQLYGLADENGLAGPVTFKANRFSGVTSATRQASVQGTWRGDEWQTYTPTVSCLTGTPVSTAASGAYRYEPTGSVLISIQPSSTGIGTCADGLVATLPVAAFNDLFTQRFVLTGTNLNTGVAVYGLIGNGASSAIIKTYNDTFPIASGQSANVTGLYRVAQ